MARRPCNMQYACIINGRALLQAYRDNWLPRLADMDEFLESGSLPSSLSGKDHVKGGERLSQQEAVLNRKEASAKYRILSRSIEKMDRILNSLSEAELFIIENYSWGGLPWYEVASVLNVSKSAFYLKLWGVEERVGREWGGLDIC